MRGRLLHIIGDSKFGGCSKIILELSKKATSIGYNVDILTTDEVLAEEAQKAGIGVVEINVIRREIRPLWDVAGLVKLFMFLKKSGYDIIHTHTSKAGFVGRLAAHAAGMPLIIHTVQGFAFHEESSKIGVFMFSLFERFAALACDYIVFVSDFHRRWASRLNIGRERQHVVIKNGVDGETLRVFRSRDDIAKDVGAHSGLPWIVTIGRLATQKGLVYLLGAALILKRKELAFRIIIVGDGPLREKLFAFVRQHGLFDVVIFAGFQKDVGSFLSCADVIALPSLWEGLSISLLEAMALRKPIVTTPIGSNLEVVEDGVSALVAPSRDPEQFAEKLELLIRDKELREKLGAAAYKRYEEYFTLEKMLDKYMRLYNHAGDEENARVPIA